jgi:hypothetical protein
MFEEFDPSAVTLHAKTPDADRLFATTIADKSKSDTGGMPNSLTHVCLFILNAVVLKTIAIYYCHHTTFGT